MVKIRYSLSLSNITHSKETILEIEDTTIKDILEKLTEILGKDFERRMFTNGKISRFINLYVNGEDIRYLDDLNTTVKNTDEISILPAVSGG